MLGTVKHVVFIFKDVLCCHFCICSIHGFSDSAEKAYCAVGFAKVLCSHSVSVNFLVREESVNNYEEVKHSKVGAFSVFIIVRTSNFGS